MEPIKFTESNRIWGQNQEPYLPLPAYVNEEETISCWQLNWKERFKILYSGKLWLRQMNFGRALQPQVPQIDSPFIKNKD